MQGWVVRLIFFLFALLSFCTCQQPIVSSSGQTGVYFSSNSRATQYSSNNNKPNNWKQYGNAQTQSKFYGSAQTQSKYYGSVQTQNKNNGNAQTQNKYYGSVQTQNKYNGYAQTQNNYYGSAPSLYKYNGNAQIQSKYYGSAQSQNKNKNGSSMKIWGSSYSRPKQSQQLKNDKENDKPKYKSETLKTKPYAYRLKSVGRTLVDQYLQNFLPWDTCTTTIINIINTVFNPTSDFVNIFIDAGVDNWCGNKLYEILEPIISPYTDKIFEELNLERE